MGNGEGNIRKCLFFKDQSSVDDEAVRQDGIEVANLIVRDRVACQIQLPQIPQDIQRHDVVDLVIG